MLPTVGGDDPTGQHTGFCSNAGASKHLHILAAPGFPTVALTLNFLIVVLRSFYHYFLHRHSHHALYMRIKAPLHFGAPKRG